MSNDRQVELEWRTISYRTLILVALLIVAGAIILLFSGVFPRASARLRGLLTGSAAPPPAPAAVAANPALAPQARFMNVEGGVLVKRAGSPDFTPARPSATLDQGDTVQTQSGGWARIEFADGTTYLLTPNSLIVIEQNQVDADSSLVAVSVTSGRVDLSTGQAPEGRKVSSSVVFADAAAALSQNTRAEVVSNANAGSLTVMRGGANVRRGTENVRVQPLQRLDVTPGYSLQVTDVPPAPTLLTPGNLSPLPEADPATARIDFSWTAVPRATHYRLVLSRSEMLSDPVAQKETLGTHLALSGLDIGSYYWTVASIDAHGTVSPALDANKFTLLRSVAQSHLPLMIESIREIAPGVLEVDGRTIPGAKVLVNDEVVGLIQNDGSFQYVSPRLAPQNGYTVTITAEDSAGRIATRARQIDVQ